MTAAPGPLHVNYQFFLQQCRLEQAPGRRMLDYGCGGAEVVQAARAEGLEVSGVDVFYEGGDTRARVAAAGLLGDVVRPMEGVAIPFPDATFDFVFSNQVFEHVQDMPAALAEIARVLKPGGRFLAMFPDRGVIREGHCGIPCLHWFARDSRWRFNYALCLRTLGLGYHKSGKSRRQWTTDFLHWLDAYTFYRPRTEILRSFARYFTIHLDETAYLRFRMSRGALRPVCFLLSWPLFGWLACGLMRRLSGLLIESRKV